MSSTLIKNIKTIYGIQNQPLPFKKGAAMSVVEVLHDAYLLIVDDTIKAFGPNDQSPDRADHFINANNGLVLPAWCDSHTHIVFAQGREGEYVDRLKGISYEEIARNGGGILNSAARLQAKSEDQLYESAKARLDEVIQYGTGAIEIKSGYGLTTESELKMLRVIRRLKENTKATIKSTFLGAHAIPTIYKENRDVYISEIIDIMIPQVAAEG
ncbi:MAG: imidazolonepropionase, partial [Chitinophagales bacterium]|nr:imidazolonepropionase [Chitinophagales bacterium]